MSETIYLVDGSGYIFRAYYGIRPLTTSTGIPTNAVLGFAKMLLKLIKEQSPTHLGMAFDPKGGSFRKEIYPEYKANRNETPEDLKEQIPIIHELTEGWGLPILSNPGFEADDTLATLAALAESAGHKVVVVTGDKDLMQLVTENVTLYDPMKDKHYDRDGVIEKFGVPPEHVADLLALAGDSSDNIPGVPKVGPKTAAKLIQNFGEVGAVIEGLSQQEKRKAAEQSVLDNVELAHLSKRLTVVRRDVPTKNEIKNLSYEGVNIEGVTPLLKRLEAYALLRELGVKEGADASAVKTSSKGRNNSPSKNAKRPERETLSIDRDRYETVLEFDALDAIFQKAEQQKKIVFDLETTGLDPYKAEILGIAFSIGEQSAHYVPLQHRYIGCPKQLPLDKVLKKFKATCENKDIVKIAHNLKYDAAVLQKYGIETPKPYRDSMISAYILDPGRMSFGMDALARDFFGHETIKYSDICGKGRKQIGFDQVQLDDATRYAGEDADITFRLDEKLFPAIADAGLSELHDTIEIPLLDILLSMESEGIRVDRAQLQKLGEEFKKRIAQIQKDFETEIDGPINLASPKQLGALFFEKLGYPVIKKTKTGYSTDVEVMETLAKSYQLPQMVLDFRGLSKLKSTYVDALLELSDPSDGRVHTRYNQSGAATGRLSSSDPNLQNIPIRTEDGRRIREVFVARDGYSIVAADYSQVELRLMAHLSEDPAFIEAFINNEDIHNRTAREVLSLGEEPKPDDRRQAKAINFGVLYGLSEFGLAKQLGIPRNEAREFIKRYFGRYPKIRAYLDRTIEDAKNCGYVSTLFGRRRFLPDLNHKNQNVRQGAERIAMNTPIQGSAADIIKKAMITIQKRLIGEKHEAKMLLQVHDELVFEVRDDAVVRVSNMVQDEMTSVVKLRVPLTVELGSGKTWAEAH